MSADESKVFAHKAETVDHRRNGLYRSGGISMMVAGPIYILTVFLFLAPLAPTLGCVANTAANPGTCGSDVGVSSLTNAQPDRPNLPDQSALVQGAIVFFALFDLLLIPAAFALYFALRGKSRIAMIAASASLGLFVILDLGVTLPSLSSLLTLSQNYLSATSDATRATIASSMSSTWNLWSLSSIRGFFQSIFLLITSVVMLRGVFRRVVAYVGIVGSIAGIIESFGTFAPTVFIVNILFVVFLPLFGIWLVLAGLRLYRLGKG